MSLSAGDKLGPYEIVAPINLLHPMPHARLCRGCDQAAKGTLRYIAKATPRLRHDSVVWIAREFRP